MHFHLQHSNTACHHSEADSGAGNIHEYTWDTTNIKIKYRLPRINVNDIALVFYEKVPRHFWRIAIVTRVLRSRDSEIRGAIVRIAKTNTILKRPVNKLFAVENTYHDTNQTDKASHKEIASPSPAVLWIVNICERKPR